MPSSEQVHADGGAFLQEYQEHERALLSKIKADVSLVRTYQDDLERLAKAIQSTKSCLHALTTADENAISEIFMELHNIEKETYN